MVDKKYEIRIQVATQYVDHQSEPDIDRYVFAYTITIENIS
ncbi:MAG: Co2+/Mg2+ efflux protein ApaG, partial [Woeseiales bacterium]